MKGLVLWWGEKGLGCLEFQSIGHHMGYLDGERQKNFDDDRRVDGEELWERVIFWSSLWALNLSAVLLDWYAVRS